MDVNFTEAEQKWDYFPLPPMLKLNSLSKLLNLSDSDFGKKKKKQAWAYLLAPVRALALVLRPQR